MPIKRISYIKNIGRLVNCVQQDPPLKKYNVFFAGNGRGKTTLCAILRSLQTRESAYIDERVTINSDSNHPKVSICFDTGTITYDGTSWSNKPKIPEIVIFDSTFIADNVHAGEHMTRDQRIKQLEIIIGESDIKLVKAVESVSKEIRKKTTEIGEVEKNIKRHLQGRMEIEKFLNLGKDSNIDKKILKKTNELKASNRSKEIIEHPVFVPIKMPALPKNFKAVLAKELADVSNDAESQLLIHLDLHEMRDEGQEWISKGLQWIRDDNCPFCGQGTHELSLVKAYKQFFSKSFTTLINEINILQQNIVNEFGDTVQAEIGTKFAHNKGNLEFWKQIEPIELTCVDYNGIIFESINALRQLALFFVESKLRNPSDKVILSDAFQKTDLQYSKAVALISAYNKQINAANTIIEIQKRKIQTVDSEVLAKEIVELNFTKLRHSSEIIPMCSEYTKLVSDKKKMEENKKIADKNLIQHGGKRIKSYEKSINKLLGEFGATFSITNSKRSRLGDAPSFSYQLQINEKAFMPGSEKTPLGKPCFRTALSAGDKSALALAFFLTQLDHNPKKEDCIVIFDDPITSLDNSRRTHTVTLLQKYGKESAQLLLFSHDPLFLHQIYSKLPRCDRRSLELFRVFGKTNDIEASAIREWDSKKEVEDRYFADYAVLKLYLRGDTKSSNRINIVRKIRPVLECYLHHRFPHIFVSDDTLGMMIGKIKDPKIKNSFELPIDSMIQDLESINDFSNPYHHDGESRQPRGDLLNDNELRVYVKRTLDIIHKG